MTTSETVILQSDGRLDSCFAQAIGISRAQAAKWIIEGLCTCNGVIIQKPSLKVRAGDCIGYIPPEPQEAEAKPENIPIRILYEDADLVIVSKPCGMVVHPAAGNESGTLVNALLYAINDLSTIGGVRRPGIVHRLDKDTSGLLMIAKNDSAHQALSEQLSARTMEKHYLAVVEGCMKENSGRIDNPIARCKNDRKRMAIDPEGREAHTRWQLLENLKQSALLDVHILTGRTHQIRVHMRSLQHPVAGDSIYGFSHGIEVPRLMLHAWRLTLTHPSTGERMTFTDEPDELFQETILKLKG